MPEEESVEEVRAVHRGWSEQTAAQDLDGMMANIAPDVVSYEHAGPLSYEGVNALREVCRSGLEASAGPIAFDVPDMRVRADGDLAVAWGIDRIVADGAEVRSTRDPRLRAPCRELADDPPAPVVPRPRADPGQARTSNGHTPSGQASPTNRSRPPA